MSQSWLNRKRRYFKTNFESFFVLVESFSLRLTFENFPPLHWFCLRLTVFSDSVRSITKNTQPIRCKTRPKLGHLRLALERSFRFWVWLPLFTLNTHWLLVLLILVLIGCCGYSLLTAKRDRKTLWQVGDLLKLSDGKWLHSTILHVYFLIKDFQISFPFQRCFFLKE